MLTAQVAYITSFLLRFVNNVIGGEPCLPLIPSHSCYVISLTPQPLLAHIDMRHNPV